LLLKQVIFFAPDTSDNKQPVKKVQNVNPDTAAGNMSDTQADIDYMRTYTYTTKGVARMLNRSITGINKIAREHGWGYLQGNTRIYTPEEVEAIKTWIEERSNRRRGPARNVTLEYEIFVQFDRFRRFTEAAIIGIKEELWEIKKQLPQ